MKICLISLNYTRGDDISFLLTSKNLESLYYYPFTTESLRQFGETAEGINLYIDYVYGKYDALLEFPYCMSFDYLYEKNPNNKFVYVDLPKQDWVQAMILSGNNGAYEGPAYAFEKFFCNKYVATGKDKMQDLTEEELGQIYDAHKNAVEEFFQDKGSLLRISHDDEYFSTKLTEYIS